MKPTTLAEAQAHRYGEWAGSPSGRPYQAHRCAAAVAQRGGFGLRYQCIRANGHGPEGLWCKQHAAKQAAQA